MNAVRPPVAPASTGNVYELRSYRGKPAGGLKQWLDAFTAVLPAREKHSKIVGLWTSEEGQPTAATHASPADVASAKRAARAFLAGYLPYIYGHHGAARLRGASGALRHQLATHPPRVPARERQRHPRLVTVQSNGVSPDHAEIAALVDDGHRHYTIVLELTRRGRRWLITSLQG